MPPLVAMVEGCCRLAGFGVFVGPVVVSSCALVLGRAVSATVVGSIPCRIALAVCLV